MYDRVYLLISICAIVLHTHIFKKADLTPLEQSRKLISSFRCEHIQQTHTHTHSKTYVELSIIVIVAYLIQITLSSRVL